MKVNPQVIAHEIIDHAAKALKTLEVAKGKGDERGARYNKTTPSYEVKIMAMKVEGVRKPCVAIFCQNEAVRGVLADVNARVNKEARPNERLALEWDQRLTAHFVTRDLPR